MSEIIEAYVYEPLRSLWKHTWVRQPLWISSAKRILWACNEYNSEHVNLWLHKTTVWPGFYHLMTMHLYQRKREHYWKKTEPVALLLCASSELFSIFRYIFLFSLFCLHINRQQGEPLKRKATVTESAMQHLPIIICYLGFRHIRTLTWWLQEIIRQQQTAQGFGNGSHSTETASSTLKAQNVKAVSLTQSPVYRKHHHASRTAVTCHICTAFIETR